MSVTKWILPAIILILLVGCSGQRSGSSGGTVDGLDSEVSSFQEDENDENAPFQLSEGTAGFDPGAVDLPVAETSPLSPTEVESILVRLPAVQTELDDVQEYRLPDQSLRPPRPGEEVDLPFPPPEAADAPDPESDGPLEVLRFAPEGEVPIVPQLSVTFNQAMVPLTSHEELAAQDVPVKLEPEVAGSWRWVGTRTLFFEAENNDGDRFPMATIYSATIPEGTESALGNRLEEEVSWTFRTPPPQMQSSYPRGGPHQLDPLLFATFDQSIDPESVLDSVLVTARGQTYPVRLATDEEIASVPRIKRMTESAAKSRWIVLKSEQEFPKDTTVTVTFAAGMPSAEGPLVTAHPQSYSFQTYGPLVLVRSQCAWGGRDCPPFSPFQMVFSNPLDGERFDPSLVSVEPELPGLQVEIFGNVLQVRGNTKGRTRYTVRVAEALTDIYGQTLDRSVSASFQVSAMEPYLTTGVGQMVVMDPAGSPTFPFYSVNIDSALFRAYAVEPKDYADYLQWQQEYRSDDEWIEPPGRLVVERTVEIANQEDTMVETSIDLSDLLEGDHGHLILYLQPEPGLLSSLFNRDQTRRLRNMRSTTWVQVTSLGLDAFLDSDEFLVWVNSLDDGAPRGDVEVALWPTSVMGVSDENGTVSLPLSDISEDGGSLLIARSGDDSAFIPESRYYYSRGSSGWRERFDGYDARYFVFDDRAMYRPGETVSLKGWIRQITRGTEGDVELFDKSYLTAINYSVTDPLGNEIAKGETPLNSLGGFHLTFDLPENVNLGYAQVNLQPVDGTLAQLRDGFYSHSFQIQEFRRPEFEVGVTVNEGPHKVGQSAVATVSASYFAGGPLPGAEVFWEVNSSPGFYSPPNWREFTFGQWIPWWRFDSGGGENHFSTFSSRTDSAGEHHLQIDFVPGQISRPLSIQASATVMDVNRQAWGAGSNLLVHPANLYVGLRSDRYFVEEGVPLVVEVVVTDIDGEAQPGTPVIVEAARMEWVYRNGSWEETADEVQECRVETSDTADSDGTDFAECTFDTEVGGRYVITATVEDEEGRINQTELTRWVSGVSRPPSRNVEQEEIQLIPDAEEYQPGDVAEILVQAPFYPAEGMVTLRREGLVSSERFTVDGPTYTLQVPVEDGYIPNFYVQVDLVGSAPRLDAQGEELADVPPRPAYAQGSLRLSVPPLTRELRVEAIPEENRLEPGGETTLGLTVTDAQGEPVADAELAIVIVDEAILALTGYQIADPLSVFYIGRGAGVSDYHNRSDLLLIDPLLLLEQAAADGVGVVGGDAGDMARSLPAPSAAPMEAVAEEMEMAADSEAMDESAEPGSPIAVRANFDPLALFAPEVRTDEEGRATVEVSLPDNLTRYRVMVVAVEGAKQYGSGESSITARLPLMARPSAPRFLNFGDRFELPLVLQNQTDDPMDVHVVVQATNADLTADEAMDTEQGEATGYALTIPANNRVEVRFPTTTSSAGTTRFQFAAVSAPASGFDYSDAAEVNLPVFTPATTEAFAVYGEVDESGSVLQPVLPPADVIPVFGGLEVSLSSTALQALTDAYLYLIRYPYECSEQIASRILGIAALRDVMSAFDAPGLPDSAEINAAMARDIQLLQALQASNGGFPIWRRGGDIWPYYSIHVAHALARARIKDYQVPEEMISRSLNYLRNIEDHYPGWYGQRTKDALTAYSLYVRKLLNDDDPSKARQLIERRGLDDLSLESIGWLLFVLTDDPASEQTVSEIRRYIQNQVAETAGSATISSGYSDGEYLLLYSNRRADAVLLEALIVDQPESDLIVKLVRGLLGHQTRGRWRNTQENVWVLLALDRYFNTFESQTPDFVARIWLGEQYAGGHEFEGRTTEIVGLDIPMPFVLNAETGPDGTIPLTLQKEGEGRLYYRLGMQYAPTDLTLEPADHGFAVERIYEAVDDPDDVIRDESGVWRVRAGARVRVRLTMVAPSRRVHVALVDPLPAGLEAINPALAVSGEVPADPQDQENGYWWWWWTWYQHQNLRDERAEAFSSYVPAGVYTYSYVTRATTPGEFVVPPAKAEEMYSPEVFGRTGTDRVVIE